MSGHQKPNVGFSVEWFTPPEILEALGPFDSDPCQPGLERGLLDPWKGRVFLNPPYDRNMSEWLQKAYQHQNTIALIFARTETRHWFDWVWGKGHGALFIRGRLYFYKNGLKAKANAGAPSALIAYGSGNAECLRTCGIPGRFIIP